MANEREEDEGDQINPDEIWRREWDDAGDLDRMMGINRTTEKGIEEGKRLKREGYEIGEVTFEKGGREMKVIFSKGTEKQTIQGSTAYVSGVIGGFGEE